MAYVTNSAERSAPMGGSFVATLIGTLRETMQRRRLYKQTVAELSQLSSRELADLAISRCDIHYIAMEAAQGRQTR